MPNKIIIGRFGKVHGIKGWIYVHSFTVPTANILQLKPWQLKKNTVWEPIPIEDIKQQGHNIIIKLNAINDRDLIRTYTNSNIAVDRNQLPTLPQNEYYWADLIGLSVANQHGKQLGIIDHILATGANDVLAVKSDNKTMLIPYINQVIQVINLTNKQITVNWEEDYL